MSDVSEKSSGFVIGGPNSPHSEKLKPEALVMVVEDEVLVRMVLADQIREAGYRVIEASNADEALELLRHGSLDLKVAVTDIHMSGSTDGLEMSRLIKRIFPLAKIIMVSGTHGTLDGVPCDAFFLKPYDTSAIIQRIAILLDEGALTRGNLRA